VRILDIPDGTSSTYMVGEKPLDPIWYLTLATTPVASGTSTRAEWGDDGSAYQGFDDDIHRWTGIVDVSSAGVATVSTSTATRPFPDTVGGADTHRYSFGSAHPGGFNVVMCDGSVRSIAYGIAFETHRRLGGRDDGLPIDTNY
jgi:prepilin-type processing-associated H-X9-DG protein